MPLINDDGSPFNSLATVGKPEGLIVTRDQFSPPIREGGPPQSDLMGQRGTPSFTDTLGASFRLENEVVGAVRAITRDRDYGDEDPEHNPWDSIKDTKYQDYWQAFTSSRNAAETEAIRARLDQELEDRRIREASGLTGFLTDMAASITSPTVLLPGGAVYRGFRAGGAAARSAASVATAAAGGVAVQEAILHQQQLTRTWQESMLNIGGATVLGGLLGGGASYYSSRVLARAARQIDDDIVRLRSETADIASMTGRIDTPGGAQSVGAAASRVVQENIPESAFGLERAFSWQGPLTRTLASEIRAARDTITRLAEVPFKLKQNKEGIATGPAGGSVEARIKTDGDVALYRASEALHKGFAEYRYGNADAKFAKSRAAFNDMLKPEQGRLNWRDYKSEITKALRSETGKGIEHPIPQVKAAAEAFRKEVFEPFKKEAQKLGLFPEDAEFSFNYVMRRYDINAILNDYERFKQILVDHLKGGQAKARAELAQIEREIAASRVEGDMSGEVDALRQQFEAERARVQEARSAQSNIKESMDADREYRDALTQAVQVQQLDMSPAARMARAKEMGFDTSNVWYHGTTKDFSEFTFPGGHKAAGNYIDGPGEADVAIFLSSSPDVASGYAAAGSNMGEGSRVIPAYIRMRNPREINLKGELYRDENAEIIEESLKRGNDGIIYTYADGKREAVVFHPSNIRSVNAAFNPQQSSSAKLIDDPIVKVLDAERLDVETRMADEKAAERRIRAFHGSPHEFDRFDGNFLGHGEGTYFEGRGHYFAEQEDVAKWYRDTLSARAGKDGHLYEVAIKANKSMMLDLDKPAAQQTPAVRDALTKVVKALHWPMTLDELDLKYILREVPNIERWLSHYGIPGVRYLDQQSRASGKGTSNIVVFDDDLVEIVSRDGVPVKPQEQADEKAATKRAEDGDEPVFADGKAAPEPSQAATAPKIELDPAVIQAVEGMAARLGIQMPFIAGREMAKEDAGAFLRSIDLSPLTSQERAVLASYATTKHELDFWEDTGNLELMRSIASKIKAPEDIVVWRGTSKAEDFDARLQDDLFIPVSLDREWAETMAQFKWAEPAMHKLVIPKGSPIIPIVDHLAESEILIPPKTLRASKTSQRIYESGADDILETAFQPLDLNAMMDTIARSISDMTGMSKGTDGADLKALRAKADELRFIADADDAELSQIAADTISKITGSPAARGVNPYDAAFMQGPSGPLHARTLKIPDEKIVDFLDDDIERIALQYVRSMAPDVALTREFGDLNLTEDLKRIEEEAQKLMAANPERAAEIDAQSKRAQKDIQAVVARLRGTYNLAHDPTSFGPRAAQVAKQANVLRLMGAVLASSIADVPKLLFVHGFRQNADLFGTMIQNLGNLKMAKAEAKELSAGLEFVLSRSGQMWDAFEDMAGHTFGERALRVATNKMGRLTLMDQWNATFKQLSGIMTMNRVLRASVDLVNGRIKPKELEKLAASGIGDEMAERIAAQYQKHGTVYGRLFLPNANEWDDSLARQALSSAVRREADLTITTPGQERPLWTSGTYGSVVGQFRTFQMISIQRTLIAGLQEMDAAKVSAMAMMISLGMLSEQLKSIIHGKDGKNLPKDMGDWMYVGMANSGILGWLTDADQMAHKVSRGNISLGKFAFGRDAPTARFASQNAIGSLLGPTYGAGADIIQAIGAASAGEVRESDIHAMRRLMPYQNLFYISRALRAFEEGMIDAAGVPRTQRRN